MECWFLDCSELGPVFFGWQPCFLHTFNKPMTLLPNGNTATATASSEAKNITTYPMEHYPERSRLVNLLPQTQRYLSRMGPRNQTI